MFSTIECNPLLDLSDYITPITGDGCCFRLEYIDSLVGFVGGDPYGIRIYRDNETQNTLYYDFGSEVFAGDSAIYYDPMNDNVIEFCVDPDDLDNDGGKIVIEFQDNNGKIICVKTVEVECLDCCSDENLQLYLESEPPTPDCCAYLLFDIDTVNSIECGFDFVNIYDNIDTSSIAGFNIIRWQDTLFSVPFAFCNYDTVAKQLLVEFYDEDSTLICSKVTPQFLLPCEVTKMVGSGSNEKEPFDMATKTLKTKEITFEYYIKEDEKIEIELFNKYNVSLGVILSKESKKGTNEFTLNIEKYKSDLYVFKMKGSKEEILRRLIIE